MKPSDQPTMRRSCEAGDYAELADALPKVRGVAPYRAIKQQSHRPAEILREYNGALYVENGPIVPRSETVKTASGGTLLGVKLVGGRDTDLYAIDSVTGELHGFMPKPPCKQTMQNSSELAESHRFLTVTDEAFPPMAQTEIHASQNVIIPERKSNLPLPNTLSLGDFEALMAPQCLLSRPSTAQYGPSAYPMGVKGRTKIEPTPRRPIGSYRPNRNLYSWNDNTVGPVTLASGYGSNTFPYSAAHVLDPNTVPTKTSLINSNLVLHDNGLSNASWVPPNTICFTGSYTDSEKITVSPGMDTFYMWPKSSHFTGSTSYVLTETNKDVPKIPSFTGSTLAVTRKTNNSGPKITSFTLKWHFLCNNADF